MSSYADVAAHGPAQSDEDKRAHPVAELQDHSTVDTKDVTTEGQSINVVPNDFREQEIKTETQASQHERDAVIEEEKQKLAERKAELEKKAKAAAKKTENALLAAGKDARTYNLIDSLLLVTLGVVGYRRYREGTLDLQTVAVGVVGLGLFAGVQNYVQRWFTRQ